MSLGSDYAGGYNLGLNTKASYGGGSQSNPWPYLSDIANVNLRRSLAMGGGGGGGGGKSAKQILEESRLEALKVKEQELNNRAKEIEITANEQAVKQSRMQEVDRRAKEAEDRAQGLRTQNEVAAKTKETDMGKQAIEGAYTRKSQPIMDYINRNGNKDANAEAVDFVDPDGKDTGKVYIKFSDGNTVMYPNASEFGKQVVLPMEAIRQDIAGQVTGKEQAQIDVQKEKNIGLSTKEWGKQSAKQKVPAAEQAKIIAKFITDYQKANGNMPDENVISEFKKTTFGEGPVMNRSGNQRTPTEAGLDTAGRSVRGKTESPGSQKTVVRTGKDKNGRKVAEYSDGSIGYLE
jgi:hypothetical protein